MILQKYKNKLLFIFILFSVISAFFVGSFWDVFFHLEIGQRRLKYLFSFGKFYKFENVDYGVEYYPGVYDTISYFFITLFPQSFKLEIYNTFSFFIGLIGIIGLKKFCKILFNKNISYISFIITLFTPIFFGQMLFNPKDIVVASSYFWILYYLTKYFFLNNKINKKIIAFKLGLFIALGTGSKILFVGLLIPLGIILSIEYFYQKNKILIIKENFLNLTILFFVAYFFTVIFWPQTHSNIFIEPIKLLIEAIKNQKLFGVPFSLYANQIVNTEEVPWHYIPINFLFKTPLYIIIILLFGLINIKKINLYFNNELTDFEKKNLYLLIIIFTPIIISILANLKLYDGLRNYLFLIPIINIIVAQIIYYLIKNIRNLLIKIFSFICLLSFLYSLFIYIILTPYQYTYLNELNKLFYNDYSFENDYLGTSLKKLIKNFSLTNDKKEVKIASCINHVLTKHYLNKYNLSNLKLVGLNDNFDFVITNNRPINSKKTCRQFYLEKNYLDVASVKRNKVILSSIMKK